MSNKIKKYGAFLFYSYSIYNSYLLVFTILDLFRDIPESIEYLLFTVFLFVIFPVCKLPDVFEVFHIYISSPLRVIVYYSIPLFIILAFNVAVFYVWYKKQTIFRAWLMAITGMLFSPGLVFFLGAFEPGVNAPDGLLWLFSVNMLYGGLFVANAVQKFLWPDNKFCNAIRAILKWPCLKT